MLTQARGGHSTVLVIQGEPGLGKASLLRYAARQASGLRVVEVIGVQVEMELPLSGIQRLWAPLLGALDELPEPQQNALRVASGITSAMLPIGSWSPLRFSTCSLRLLRSARPCAW